MNLKKIMFLMFLISMLYSTFYNTFAGWNYYVQVYTPNYEDHIDIDTKNIRINNLEPNSTYKIIFRYSADIFYDIGHDAGSVSASWEHPSGWTKIFSFSGRIEGGKASVSSSFSTIVSTKDKSSISLTVRLWAVADGGASNGYDTAEIVVRAFLTISSIEKVDNDDDNDGGGGYSDRKYSRLNVKAYTEKGGLLYHIPINVSEYKDGTYKTPFYLSKVSNSDSSFTVTLTAPLKYVTPSTVRYFINWSVMKSPYSNVLIKWSLNNTIEVYVPNDCIRESRAFYTHKYYWYRMNINSSIPVLISYQSDIGSGVNCTPFTLYKESVDDEGLSAVLQAPYEIFYNETLWIFKFWKYKIPDRRIRWSISSENPKEFSCPRATMNTAIIYAVYERYARIVVESEPIKNVPVSVKYQNFSFINYTDFVIPKIAEGMAIDLEVPEFLSIDGKNYKFSHWLINGKPCYDRRISFNAFGFTRVIALYSLSSGEGEYKVINLGADWLLPGESINITLPYSGNYTFIVDPLYDISANLTALIVSPDMRDYKYVDLSNLSVKAVKPYKPKIGSSLISPDNLTDYPQIITGRFYGWYFLGASAWMPALKSEDYTYFDIVFCEDNWTTYAIYDLSIIWNNYTAQNINSSAKGIVWKKRIVVTSINFTVEGLFEADKLYIIWKVSYRFMPPPKLNLTLELPHQDIWLTLEKDGDILFAQKLGRGFRFFGISDYNRTVTCDYIVPLDILIEKFGYEQVILNGRVRWSGPLDTPINIVPFSEEKDIPLVFVGMQLLEYNPSPLHLLFKWTILNDTLLPGYSQYCPCVRIDMLTEWDGVLHANVGVRSKRDPTLYVVDLDVDASWPNRVTVFFVQKTTRNILLVVPPTRL